jgi:hypothetical protein
MRPLLADLRRLSLMTSDKVNQTQMAVIAPNFSQLEMVIISRRKGMSSVAGSSHSRA